MFVFLQLNMHIVRKKEIHYKIGFACDNCIINFTCVSISTTACAYG